MCINFVKSGDSVYNFYPSPKGKIPDFDYLACYIVTAQILQTL